MRERRPLFTSVRRAILRVAFLADLVLAIWIPSRRHARDPFRAIATAEKTAAASRRPPPDRPAYRAAGSRASTPAATLKKHRLQHRVGAAQPTSGHLFGTNLIIARRHGGGIAGREGCKRRHDAGERRIAVNMREQRLDARHQ